MGDQDIHKLTFLSEVSFKYTEDEIRAIASGEGEWDPTPELAEAARDWVREEDGPATFDVWDCADKYGVAGVLKTLMTHPDIAKFPHDHKIGLLHRVLNHSMGPHTYVRPKHVVEAVQYLPHETCHLIERLCGIEDAEPCLEDDHTDDLIFDTDNLSFSVEPYGWVARTAKGKIKVYTAEEFDDEYRFINCATWV